MKVSDIEDNEFDVKCDNVSMTIRLDSERKLITIYFFNKFDNLKFEDAVSIVNTINDNTILVRYNAHELDDGDILIWADYSMTYEEGLIAFHLFDNTKMVERFTVSTLTEYFADYL